MMGGDTMAAMAGAATPRAAGVAVQLRNRLEMLLGSHMLLMTALMRDRIADAGPRTQAVLDAVQANATDLAGAVRAFYGVTSADRFEELWTFHVKRLFDYAGALQARDAPAQRSARTDLMRLEHDLGVFLSTATGGAAKEADVQAALRMHVDELLAQAQAFHARDFAHGEALEVEGFNHMLVVADEMATAIATSKHQPTGDLASPRRRLQSAFAGLLAAHMGLMVETMRAAIDGEQPLSAAGTALNENSTAVAQAFAALYGRAAAQRFLSLWARHVEALVAYAGAVATGNTLGEDKQKAALSAVATEIAKLLATATQGRLPAVRLTAALTTHDVDLADQADAYAARDYERSQRLADGGYAHMFDLAETLADAIGDAVASRLPQGGAQTGGGGMARQR